MKPKLDPETNPAQKMERFQVALKRVLTVSKDELKQALATEGDNSGTDGTFPIFLLESRRRGHVNNFHRPTVTSDLASAAKLRNHGRGRDGQRKASESRVSPCGSRFYP